MPQKEKFRVAKIRFSNQGLRLKPVPAHYFCKKLAMSSREWYKEWFNSPFYHKLYFEHDEEEARKFIRKLIQCLQPKQGSRMLDVACGRGRHSIFLAEMGYDVTGIDLSEVSIAYAKQFEND